MSIDIKKDAKPSERTTQSKKNAGGHPIIPVLVAVAIVTMFMFIYRFNTLKNNRIDTTEQAGVTGTYQVPYQVSTSSTTAQGQYQRGTSLPPSTTQGSAAWSNTNTNEATGMAGSSSMPMEPSPTPSPAMNGAATMMNAPSGGM